MHRKRILVFCDFYLPGHKSGGGMWTIVNLVERFSDRYDFYIITRNHDGVNDLEPYSEVETNAWNQFGKSRVFYASKNAVAIKRFVGLAAEVAPDLVFLNSVFSKPVRMFLEGRRKGFVPEIPVVLAPCGELSSGALSIKPLKKKVFLQYARAVGLYDGVVWKASFDSEGDEIRRQIGIEGEVLVAPDLAPKTILPDFDSSKKPAKAIGTAKFIFVSRIARKKNILFLLELLQRIGDAKIDFEIVGPVEDEGYWQQCLSAIKRLPPNIIVKISGPLHHTEVLKRLERSHFFILPTLHENFGYVFLEALAAGTPILISENTAWSGVEAAGVGRIARLDQMEEWIEMIRRCCAMNAGEFHDVSASAREFALGWLNSPEHEQATARVLERALHKHFQIASQ